ncbi:MAG: AraC family transcriptional regulator [Myxococcales bacterium]
MSQDVLSEVLRAVRLQGAVFFSVQANEPWVAEAPAARDLAHHVLPGAEHVIEYHLVTEGSCYGGLVGDAPIRLEAGDIIVFPQGDAHTMASAPGLRGDPTWNSDHSHTARLPIALSLGEQRKAPTARLICGFLGCDARPFNPLLDNLPRVLHVRPQADGANLTQLVQLALSESSTQSSGSGIVIARVSELLFVEVVRRYIASLPEDDVGWLAGLRDTAVGRSLSLLHARPAHPWSLEELARESGASRSVLAARFLHLVGMPPMQYLARWRMQLASAELAAGGKKLVQIASEVGYGSEAAFSRAFKREVGVAPAEYRRTPR